MLRALPSRVALVVTYLHKLLDKKFFWPQSVALPASLVGPAAPAAQWFWTTADVHILSIFIPWNILEQKFSTSYAKPTFSLFIVYFHLSLHHDAFT